MVSRMLGRRREPPPRTVATALCAVVAALLAVAAGCSVNPATGERQLVLVDTSQEIAMGREADREIVDTMGLYDDPALAGYVAELGKRLAADSERPRLPWSFKVIDDPVVNAFALPGGFVYTTRGILAHFDSEAELAAVLGHEIGHVTARHSAEQLSRAQLAGLGLGVVQLVEELRPYGGLAALGVQLMSLKFSRDDERQADDLGLRYMVAAGYDPEQMAAVFATLGRVSGGARLPVWASTHPAPENRTARILAAVAALPAEAAEGVIERESYLRRLDGLDYGDDPEQGYAVGSTFYHPGLAFRLDFPVGWTVINQRQAVGAVSPGDDAVTVLTLAEQQAAEQAMEAFFARADVTRGESRGGLVDFTTVATASSQQTLAGVVGFVHHGGHLFRLLGYAAAEGWPRHEATVRRSLASFAELRDRRYLDVEPRRLRLVRLERATTVAELAADPVSTADAGELALLNGVEPGATLPAGALVKQVVGGELPDR